MCKEGKGKGNESMNNMQPKETMDSITFLLIRHDKFSAQDQYKKHGKRKGILHWKNPVPTQMRVENKKRQPVFKLPAHEW